MTCFFSPANFSCAVFFLCSIQRDKEAAQRAAEVLEEEVHVLHKELALLHSWRQESQSLAHREDNQLAHMEDQIVSVILSKPPPIEM
jgi:hypothetical protein